MNTDDVAITSIGEVPKGATVKKKRNILVGTASVAVAVLAIGGGASASSRAMASDPAVQQATFIIVQMNGGEAVTCTFDDVDLPVPANALPGLAPEAGESVIGGSGVLMAVPDGAEIAPTAIAGTIGIAAMASTSDPSVIVQGVDGAVTIGEAPRQGTADECAAMRKDLPPVAASASAVPASTQGP